MVCYKFDSNFVVRWFIGDADGGGGGGGGDGIRWSFDCTLRPKPKMLVRIPY